MIRVPATTPVHGCDRVTRIAEEHVLRLEEAEIRRFVLRDDGYRFAAIGPLPETAVDPQTAFTLDELRLWGLVVVDEDGVLVITAAGSTELDVKEAER